MHVTRFRWLLLLVALAAAAPSACGPLPGSQGRHKHLGTQKERDLKKLETSGLVIGEFTLAPNAIVDGDTIKVAGLDSSLRLLGLDAEETFKKESERRAFEGSTWEEYLAKGRGGSKRPVKLPTPLGEDAKHFAQDFFKGVKTVRLERDHPGEIRDYFDRYLAYVFVERDGKWVNYNVECVRAGMSPYFSKYGYSRRFHEEFVRAQDEARAARRGIWAPGGQHYDDYDERLRWWNQRGDEIAAFEREAEGKDNWIVLTRWDALDRLEKHVGEEVVLLGAVSDMTLGDRGPTIVKLSRRRGQDFTIVFFDKDVFGTSKIEDRLGEYVAIRGVVSKYKHKKRNREELQIVVNLPGQVMVPGQEGWNAQKSD
jgi:endonuclease YncB( thermonuclease family)